MSSPTKTIKGKWVMKSTINPVKVIDEEITFTYSNLLELQCTRISCDSADGFYVHHSNGAKTKFNPSSYETNIFDFGDTPIPISKDFYIWVSANMDMVKVSVIYRGVEQLPLITRRNANNGCFQFNGKPIATDIVLHFYQAGYIYGKDKWEEIPEGSTVTLPCANKKSSWTYKNFYSNDRRSLNITSENAEMLLCIDSNTSELHVLSLAQLEDGTWETPFRISGSAFKNRTSLEKVTIHEGITSILHYAFKGCSNLREVTFPEGLIDIWERAFEGCTSLSEISLPESLTELNNGGIFGGCTSLTTITIPNAKTVDCFNFYSCNNLSVLNFGKGVESITDFRFLIDKPKLESINVNTNNGVYSSISGVLFNKSATELLLYPRGKSNSSYTIRDSVVQIGDSAFSGNTTLTSITMHPSVEVIGDSAFSECQNLSSLYLHSGLRTIGVSAFKNCEKLDSLVIPDSVHTIGSSAFLGCAKLKSMTIPNSVTTLNASQMFSGCSSLTEVSLPANMTEFGNAMFSNCTSLQNFTIPSNVTSINWEAFSGCTSLTKVVIPNNVTSIGQSAYEGCTNLTEVAFASYSNLKEIGALAFKSTALTDITLPDSVVNIGSNAFSVSEGKITTTYNGAEYVRSKSYAHFALIKGESGLSTVEIPSDTRVIAEEAFEYRTSLTSISIPENVVTLGAYAFYECSNLKTVTFHPKCRISYLPGQSHFCGCSSLESISLPDGIPELPYYMFGYCSSLKSIELPSSITKIEQCVFANCSSLSSITFRGTVSQWNSIVHEYSWWKSIPATEVVCSDGTVTLS